MRILIFLGFCIFTVYTAHPVAAFLHGTSSSGKSSLSQHIAAHENWKVVASLYWDYFPQYLHKSFPAEFACISAAIEHESITHAVRRNNRIFKQEITDSQKQNALEAINTIQNIFSDFNTRNEHMNKFKEYTFDRLQTCLKSNAHTLIDLGWYVKIEDVQKIYPGPIVQFLAYCSLNEIIHRIVKRNQEAAARNITFNSRFFMEGLTAFLRLYDITDQPTGAIDTLTKESLEQSLNLVTEHINKNQQPSNDNRFIVKEFTLSEFEQYKTSLLKKFENATTLYVVPRIHYDILIRTEQLSPKECAQKIIEYHTK